MCDPKSLSRLNFGRRALCLLPIAPLSVVTDVVATLSHRAWTTNRVFPLTDSICWLSATQRERGTEKEDRKIDRKRERRAGSQSSHTMNRHEVVPLKQNGFNDSFEGH